MTTMDTIAEKYQIGRKIGSDTFGDIHSGTIIFSGEMVTIRVESTNLQYPRLEHEAHIYKSLAGGVGIPSVHWFGTQADYKAIVLDPLGPSLEDLLKDIRKFSLKAVLLLADQLISRIEHIHAKSFIHGDINPNNFRIGSGKQSNQINVINFGFAKRYRGPKTHVGIPTGANTHQSIEQSRRDDLESLGYVMLHFLGGSLPWQWEDTYERIAEQKTRIPIDVLCRGAPDEFATYLRYTRSLGVDDTPNYSYLREIFRGLFVRKGFQYDISFWAEAQLIQQAASNTTMMTLSDAVNNKFGELFVVHSVLSNLNIKNDGAPIRGDQAGGPVNEVLGKIMNGTQAFRPEVVTPVCRTLLDIYYDFFILPRHADATPAQRMLAANFSMPVQMWQNIRMGFELLRAHLPASRDSMVTFHQMAYSRMACLYETVPAFEDVWIECLGALGRFRRDIEDDDCDREHWTAVSRTWYSKVSHKAPTVGKLYYHLADLASRNPLQQFFYYAKSLCVKKPFPYARESITIWFERIMSPTSNARLSATELYFVKTHGVLFSGKQDEELEATMNRFLARIVLTRSREWYHVGVINICATMGYGDESSPIVQALRMARPSEDGGGETGSQHSPQSQQDEPMHSATSHRARRLFHATYDVACRHFQNSNVLPFLHVTLVFIHHLKFFCPEAMARMEPEFPYEPTASMLNQLMDSSQQTLAGLSQGTERLIGAPEWRPLPEDYALRGFPFFERYYPNGRFATEGQVVGDDDDLEEPWMTEERKKRIFWLGSRIADAAKEGGKGLQVFGTECGWRFKFIES